MKFFKDEKAVSEVVGAMMILLILVLYLGIMQTRQVPEWNKELEIQQFGSIYDDFVTLRSNLEDVSAKSIPKTSNFHMGVKYPQRFMLSNPGPGASGILSTHPLRINISYDTNKGTKWKNYTSMGIIYEQDGISDSPRLIYENGLMMKDYGNGIVIAVDDNQSLTSKDNIFIPILYGAVESSSSMEIESMNIAPIPNEGFSQVKFLSMNATVETRYPKIWTDLSKQSRPDGSNFTIENGTKCRYGNSNDSCLKLTNIPGYNVKKLNLPNNDIQSSRNQMYMGMVTFDNSLLNSRGPTGPDGQDMFEKGQGRLDIPAGNKATQFLIQDIIMARSKVSEHEEEHEEEHEDSDQNDIRLRFSVTDTTNLWTVEIKFSKTINNTIKILSVKQKYPQVANNNTYNISDNTYNNFTNRDITADRSIDLTQYYKSFSNISSPNALTIDRIDQQILYVNFVIN
ncbi:MAG: hypothetical protein OIN86_13430 [Candidatus Methanoperedens sp.]|nr:hypothetical protein [Candidatus Methanoperedens sp.]CAG0949956.1 hypothetical protein METP1_00143 [Methanosarcinales archaeon]